MSEKTDLDFDPPTLARDRSATPANRRGVWANPSPRSPH